MQLAWLLPLTLDRSYCSTAATSAHHKMSSVLPLPLEFQIKV